MSAPTGENADHLLLRNWRIILSIAIIFSFVFNLLRLTGPLFIILVHDQVLVSRSEEKLIELFLLVALFLLVMGTVDYSRRRILARLGAQFQERLEERIFSATARGKLFSPGIRKPVAGLNEIDNLRGFVHSDALIAVLDFMWAPMFLIVVFYFHWMLGWTVILGLLGLLALSFVKASSASEKKDQSKAARREISNLKEIILMSRGVIRSPDMSSGFKARWLAARQSSRDNSIELNDWSSWFSIFSRQIRLLLQYSVLAVGAYLVLNGELSVGAMIASMFLSVRVLVPVGQFINEIPAIRRAAKNWKHLKKILANRNDVVEKAAIEHPGKELALHGVCVKSNLTGTPLLGPIDLSIEPGTVVEITGKSGSGKTVLAKTILGICPGTSGTVLYGSTSIDDLSLDQAQRVFGYLPESAALIRGSIEENISGLATCADSGKVSRAANLAQIHELISTLPDGYQTEVDPTNNWLSSGQSYQITLARALYDEPNILIIDEPGLFLRENHSKQMNLILVAMGRLGCATIILSRERLSSVNPDCRYTLEKGHLKASAINKNVVKLRTQGS